MKVIIIDDEDMVREAIRILGHWADLGIDSVLSQPMRVKRLE